MVTTPAQFQEAFLRGVSRGLYRVAQGIIEVGSGVIEREAIDEGTLLGSSEVRDVDPLRKEAAWTARHAVHVHQGRRPGAAPPPFKAILAWVRRNLSVSTYYGLTGTQRTTGFKAVGGERVRNERLLARVAWAVRAKIARDGIPPKPFAAIGAQRVGPRAPGIVQAEVEREIRRLGGKGKR